MTRILLAQINTTIGDFAGNTQKILDAIAHAKKSNCTVVVTPELGICGYPPKDLIYHSQFVEECEKALQTLVNACSDITLLVGCIRKNPGKGKPVFNSCAVIQNQKLVGYYDKRLLPTYNVFDEIRYYEPGKQIKTFEIDGKKIGITICEDLWYDDTEGSYLKDPVKELSLLKPDLMINLSSSPFELHKLYKRIALSQNASQKAGCPILYCNQVGGNDSLLFDGYSFAANADHLFAIAKGFTEDYLVFDSQHFQSIPPPQYINGEQIQNALVLGIRDYFHKLGFKKAFIGLSGGVDSAVVTALATMALGAENVTAISMPSRFSSEHSITDAEALAHNLKIKLIKVPIENVHASYLHLLEEPFEGLSPNITEENIQSRIRGMILMAFANKFNQLVISCGNKSELAMGYATLYGDLTGGLAAIADITKTQVYELAHYLNFKKEVIPKSTIEKAPSAELAPNQKDSDTLPDYEILDKILVDYIELYKDPIEIARLHHLDLKLVQSVVKKIHQSEYKRQQSPIGIKVTPRDFTQGRRFPIVHKYT